jgi:hypothetical protein
MRPNSSDVYGTTITQAAFKEILRWLNGSWFVELEYYPYVDFAIEGILDSSFDHLDPYEKAIEELWSIVQRLPRFTNILLVRLELTLPHHLAYVSRGSFGRQRCTLTTSNRNPQTTCSSSPFHLISLIGSMMLERQLLCWLSHSQSSGRNPLQTVEIFDWYGLIIPNLWS